MKSGVITALIVTAACCVPAHAATIHATPPSKPCRFENRMDLEVVDGVWFECSCEALMVGTVCDWYEITSPAHDPVNAIRKPKHKTHRVLRYALPQVVA